MSLDDFSSFLSKFLLHYSDYNTVVFDLSDKEYTDYSLATAECLFNLGSSEGILNDKVLEYKDVIKYLNKKVIIYAEVLLENFWHAFVLIPFDDCVIVIQSLSKIYAAFYTVYAHNDIIKKLKLLDDGKTKDIFFFDYIDLQHKSNVRYKVFKRKNINVKLLPNLESYSDRLFKGRQIFTKDVKFKNENIIYEIPKFLKLYREPDAFDIIFQMYHK